MQAMESEGRTVADAVDNALKRMGLRRDQVEVQILQEASSGFMGLGAKPARVRITEKRWGPEGEPAPAQRAPSRSAETAPRSARPPAPQRRAPRPESRPAPAASAASQTRSDRPREARPPIDAKAACAGGESLAKEVLGLMGLSSLILANSWDAAQERVKITVTGEGADSLLGAEGKTLESLQFLLTLILSRRLGSPVAIQVDALGYWDKKEQDILSTAQRGIEEVKSTGKPCRLPPMDSAMRRLIHRNLAGHPDVETASEGEGSWRKIVLRPRKK